MLECSQKTGVTPVRTKSFSQTLKNEEPLSSQDAAKKVIEYFVNQTKDYSKIHDHHLVVGSDFELSTVSRNSVRKKLYEINMYKSPGSFDPPQKIIKRFAEVFSIPLIDIINSYREKRFGKIREAYNLTQKL